MYRGMMTRAAALGALLWVGGCIQSEDPMDPIVTNEPPVAVGLVPPLTVAAGSHIMVDVSAYFQDPDGDQLLFGAQTTNALVAGVSVSGSTMTVVGVSTGMVGGLIIARDTLGGEAAQPFAVTVPNEPPMIVASLPTLSLMPGDATQLNLNDYFMDPEGDRLSYSVTTSNALVAGASVSGGTLTRELNDAFEGRDREGGRERLEHELGDLLVAAAFLGNYVQIDPERALRGALRRFESRFRAMEEVIDGPLEDCTLERMIEVWQAVKRDLDGGTS